MIYFKSTLLMISQKRTRTLKSFGSFQEISVEKRDCLAIRELTDLLTFLLYSFSDLLNQINQIDEIDQTNQIDQMDQDPMSFHLHSFRNPKS